MPWKELCAMDERLRFVMLARENTANMSELCREFNISRKTGYKLLERYEEEGIKGIPERSRRPHRSPCALSGEQVCEIVELRQKHPHWGGRKLHVLLQKSSGSEEIPSIRSIERVLERCELTVPRRKRRRKHYPSGEVIQASAPNDVWTIDFKGDWRMKNGQRCYPLTIRDDYSKFVLDIGALGGTLLKPTKERLRSCFEQYGLPKYIRSDNGTPFAAIRAVQGLSSLSAWWIKLGITPNRIPPASPQCNGTHERMHLDMMRELECCPLKNLSDEQRRFDDWKAEFNTVRPHESLNMKTPAKCYRKSKRKYDSREPQYLYDRSLELRKVCGRGMVAWEGKRKFICNALRHETVAIRRENESALSVWFCDFLLGFTDENFRSPLGGNDAH